MKTYENFINEKKKLKLKESDVDEFREFLSYVDENMEEDPNLLRAAYSRMGTILKELKNGNYPSDKVANWIHAIEQFLVGYMDREQIKERAERLRVINPDSYNYLLILLNDYNELVSKYNFVSFYIDSKLFEPDSISPIE